MYYLRNRYYNPQLQRFINADNLTGSIGVVNSHNVFAYCFNNPIGYVDCEVKWPSLSGILTAVAVVAAVVTVGALCVAAVAAAPLAVATSTGIILTTTGSASVIANAMTTAAIAGKIALASAGASAVAKAVENVQEKRLRRIYTVYALKDPITQKIEYVGRTTNLAKRLAAHKRTPARSHLVLAFEISNLNYYQAKGPEQTYMLYYHTLNPYNDPKDMMHNQINGIRAGNPNANLYVNAARDWLGVNSYVWNQVSNEMYNLLGM